MPATQSEFKAFERLFNKIRKAKSEKRRSAVGTLTPAVMRKHLASGAPLDLLYGVNRDGTAFTTDDLKKFDKKAQATRKKYGAGKRGVRIDQLIKASRSVDIERCKSDIRTARFYRIFNSADGVKLHFQTSASPGSEYTHHQVIVRLDEWGDWLTSTLPFNQAAQRILNGRISFDCDCGRHQYWYRYLATIGGFAVKPLEYSYPKIRNPKLTGACCKHVLKVFIAMRGPAVQRLIMNEMRKDAEKIGFGGDRSAANRFLNQKELSTVERSARAVKTEKAFQNYLKAKRGFKKKMQEPETKAALKESRRKAQLKATTMEKIARKEQARADEAERNMMLFKLSSHMMASVYRDKLTKDQAISSFAKNNKMKVAEVQELAKNINV